MLDFGQDKKERVMALGFIKKVDGGWPWSVGENGGVAAKAQGVVVAVRRLEGGGMWGLIFD